MYEVLFLPGSSPYLVTDKILLMTDSFVCSYFSYCKWYCLASLHHISSFCGDVSSMRSVISTFLIPCCCCFACFGINSNHCIQVAIHPWPPVCLKSVEWNSLLSSMFSPFPCQRSRQSFVLPILPHCAPISEPKFLMMLKPSVQNISALSTNPFCFTCHCAAHVGITWFNRGLTLLTL